jgi:hypothetical protein
MKDDVDQLHACGRYKLVDDVSLDDVDSLYVKKIIIDNGLSLYKYSRCYA